MNKADLVKEVAYRNGIKEEQAKSLLNSVLDIVTETLERKEQVQLIGFGTFKVTHRNARVGKNPQTGEALQIPERDAPVFVAGRKLKDTVAK